MPKILKIEIDCAEKTCASEPGKFCRFVSTKHFGQHYYCHLFEEDLKDSLGNGEGWLLRCEKCLELEDK